jgi:ATP-dependent protease ClpP protease subunit
MNYYYVVNIKFSSKKNFIYKKIYFTYTKINPVELDELLKHDLWLSSDKCIKYGLVDEIVSKQ